MYVIHFIPFINIGCIILQNKSFCDAACNSAGFASQLRHFVRRCVCPGHTVGHFCKITSRSFSGNSWTWISSLPPWTPTRLSLQFLTLKYDGLILYSGPLPSKSSTAAKASHYPNSNNKDINYVKAAVQHHYQTTLAIQLID